MQASIHLNNIYLIHNTMKNIVYIATSLDGYIATLNGKIDWLTDIPNPSHDDFGFADFMNGIDAIVMGRNTFETVLSFEDRPYDKPVFVLSSTLKNIPEDLKNKVEILHGNIQLVLETIHQKWYKNLYIDGGKTIQGFLAEDYIDEIIITRVPILLWNGIPLFGNLDHQIKFSHKSTQIYEELIKSHYVRK